MNRFKNLKPREKLLAFICALLLFLMSCHMWLIQPLEQSYEATRTLLTQLQEDNIIQQNSYEEALYTTHTLQSQQSQIVAEITTTNAILESLLQKIYTPHNTFFDNLDSILTLAQHSKLFLQDIKIINEQLGIIFLKGNGKFKDIARFIHNIEKLKEQYMSLDFVQILLNDTLEFELLVQDMRI